MSRVARKTLILPFNVVEFDYHCCSFPHLIIIIIIIIVIIIIIASFTLKNESARFKTKTCWY